MTSRVWATHHPGRYDTTKRAWVPLDLSPAEKHGDLFIVIPGTERLPPVETVVPLLQAAFVNYQPNDCLLMVGHSELLACAAVLAHAKTPGKLRLLKWHRQYGEYQLVEVNL